VLYFLKPSRNVVIELIKLPFSDDVPHTRDLREREIDRKREREREGERKGERAGERERGRERERGGARGTERERERKRQMTGLCDLACS
jgi:hypothetical protein